MDFRILGPLQVLEDGRPLDIPSRGKRATVLAALLVHSNHVVPAERLMAWLWGEDLPKAAPATLHAHVWRLRDALKGRSGGDREPLLTKDSGYELRISPEALDSKRFERLVTSARALLASDPASGSSTLRDALSLWRGRALAGFEEQAFARAECVRLEELRLAAIEDLMEAEMVLGRHAAITGELQSLVAEHPARERLTAQLMRALYVAGRQSEALEAYQKVRGRLAEELGIDPSPGLRRLERAVLRQELDEPSSGTPVGATWAPTAALRHGGLSAEGKVEFGALTPFVGRERERSGLASLMERTLAGHGGLVMIGGEPGVGKTRLSQEVAAEGRQRGFLALTGHCYGAQSGLPYMPWVEIIEGAANELDPMDFRQAMGEAAPEFARLLPQLRQILPDIPPPLELPSDQQRRYTFSCISAYLARVAHIKPRLYVLEDLHWADESTLLFLEHLAERLSTVPVLIIGTYRDPPIDVSPGLATTLSELVRHRQARLLSLKRHSEAEVAGLLRALSGHSPPSGVTAAIYTETEGNAFFVEEVFRYLAETGRLLEEHGGFRTDLCIEELDVPENVRLVIGQRVDRLSETTRRVLTAAAVIGRHCKLEVLERVGGVGDDELLDSVDEAEMARLTFTERLGGETHLWFAHELVRQTLLARLSAPRRERYHLRVADALERVHVGDLDVRAADIARHLVEAGSAAEPARTAHFLSLAGDRAQAATAFEEALRHYQHALALLPTQDVRMRGSLLLKVGNTQRSLSRWEDACATWEEAVTILEGLGELESMVRLCWEFGYQLGNAYRVSDLLRLADRALAVVDRCADSDRARVFALHATALGLAGRIDEATAPLEEAKRLAQAQDDARLLGDVGFAEMLYHSFAMHLEQSLEPGRRAAAMLCQAGAPWDLGQALAYVNIAMVFRGRFEESDEIEAELWPLADRLGNRWAAGTARRAGIPKLAARAADLAALEGLAALQSQMAEETGSQGWLAYAATLRGILRFLRGEWADAEREMVEGARLAMPAKPGLFFGIHHGFLCILFAFVGKHAEAAQLVDELREWLPRPGRANMLGQWNLAVLAAEAMAVVGDVGRARQLYPLVVEALATGTLMRQYDGRLIETAAGMAAGVARLHERAEEHFETALRQAEELPHRMDRPHVRHFYATFLIDRGGSKDRDRALDLLEEAITGYHSIGMPRHEAMADAMLGQVG